MNSQCVDCLTEWQHLRTLCSCTNTRTHTLHQLRDARVVLQLITWTPVDIKIAFNVFFKAVKQAAKDNGVSNMELVPPAFADMYDAKYIFTVDQELEELMVAAVQRGSTVDDDGMLEAFKMHKTNKKRKRSMPFDMNNLSLKVAKK